MRVRLARHTDAEQGVKTLRRSIAELCFLDHFNEQQEMSVWIKNNTVKSWTAWVNDAASGLYVTDNNGSISGIGMITDKGKILLNYVNPDIRFRGVSKALLKRMEKSAKIQGIDNCTLESTLTAYPFHLHHGYKLLNTNGDAERLMIKKLA